MTKDFIRWSESLEDTINKLERDKNILETLCFDPEINHPFLEVEIKKTIKKVGFFRFNRDINENKKYEFETNLIIELAYKQIVEVLNSAKESFNTATEENYKLKYIPKF